MATVKWTAQADADFKALPVTMQVRVLKVAERLAKWPDVSGVEGLGNNLAGFSKIRTGDYRVRFSVAVGVVTIVNIRKRNEKTYDD